MLLLAPGGCVEGATGPLLATKQAELCEGLARVQATRKRRMHVHVLSRGSHCSGDQTRAQVSQDEEHTCYIS